MVDIRINAVGDICPGDKYIMGLGVLKETLKKGVDFPFDKVRDTLKTGDIVIGNLEGLLTKKIITNNSNRNFCGLPDFSEAMVRSGFNVVNVANNHILEHGENIFHETVDILKASGINVCGLLSHDTEYYSEPVIMNVKGSSIGIIGYNWVGIDKFFNADQHISQARDSIVNYTWIRNGKCNINKVSYNKNVINDIHKLKKRVDYVILLAHWGYEFVTFPPYGVIREGRSFIDAGANIVIGGHPHVIQGIEKYKNGLISYSLGNFIFDRRNSLPRYTMILNVNINSDQFTYNYIPCHINNRFQPELATKKQKKITNTIISDSNEYIYRFDGNDDNDDKIYKEYEKLYYKYKRETIFYHFLFALKKPSIIVLILKKGVNLIKLLIKKLSGENIRW